MKRRHIVPLSAALMASAALSVPTAVPASGTTATLFALEIFAPEAGAVPGPRCATDAADQVPAATADLPEGTVPVSVIQGSLPNGVRGCRVMVGIGGSQVAVYRSAQTEIRKRPLLRSGVRVIASRDEQTGVWVAERIVGRQTARNEMERAFTATVDVVSTGATEWVTTEVGGLGRQFTFDVATAPADIEPGLGSTVAVEFDTVAPPPC
jgi:hypothetical protein